MFGSIEKSQAAVAPLSWLSDGFQRLCAWCENMWTRCCETLGKNHVTWKLFFFFPKHNLPVLKCECRQTLFVNDLWCSLFVHFFLSNKCINHQSRSREWNFKFNRLFSSTAPPGDSSLKISRCMTNSVKNWLFSAGFTRWLDNSQNWGCLFCLIKKTMFAMHKIVFLSLKNVLDSVFRYTQRASNWQYLRTLHKKQYMESLPGLEFLTPWCEWHAI